MADRDNVVALRRGRSGNRLQRAVDVFGPLARWGGNPAERTDALSGPAPLPRIHPGLGPCGICRTPTTGLDIYGDPLCDPCGKDFTYCADCDDDVAAEFYVDDTWATHRHCRPKGVHRRITDCVCDEPCKSPICTCPKGTP